MLNGGDKSYDKRRGTKSGVKRELDVKRVRLNQVLMGG